MQAACTESEALKRGIINKAPFEQTAVQTAPLKQGNRKVVGPLPDTLPVGVAQTRCRANGAVAQTCAQLTLQAARCLTQDDVDASCNRLCALVGGWRAADFDAFDLRGVELIVLKPGRGRFTVEQNQGVTRAKPAHPWSAILHAHARQALQHIQQVAVAEAIELVSPVNLLGYRRLTTKFGV